MGTVRAFEKRDIPQVAELYATSLSAHANPDLQKIATYLDGVQQSGGRPDYTKPPVSGLFHQVFNLEELKALPPPTPSDLSWLLDWTGAANRINILIAIFGTPKGGPLDPAVIKRNQTEYEDQCVRAMNFMIYPMGMLGFYLCGFAFMFGGMAISVLDLTTQLQEKGFSMR